MSDGMQLTIGDESLSFAGDELGCITVHRGWFRSFLVIGGPDPRRLGGLGRREASEINAVLDRMVSSHRAKPALVSALAWFTAVHAAVHEAVTRGRWIPREAVDGLAGAHPGESVIAQLRRLPDVVSALPPDARRAVDFLEVDLRPWIHARNDEILANEQRDFAEFFDTVESQPLTAEQVRAVVTLDNRVQVIAAAGSGKTSVMVARAAYAVMRGFVRPDGMLLLAFNRDAADELRARVAARFSALGLPSDGIVATTFHSFGLKVLGEATGRKPRLASWLEGSRDVEMVTRIADELRDRSPQFAYRWDLFRLLYSKPLEAPAGEVVKSEGERIIADWLFFNGVAYEYEQPYVVDVADATHSQYRPDFYYPDADVWHEHWALDRRAGHPRSSWGMRTR